MVQDQIGPLVEWAQKNPHAVSGVWLDQTASHGDGVVVAIGLVAGSTGAPGEALALAPSGAPVDFRYVTYSAHDLQRAADLATELMVRPGGRSRVMSVRTDTAANRVVVSVSGELAVVANLHPAIVAIPETGIEPDACNPQERCNLLPYRGGLLYKDGSSLFGFGGCTSGFWAKAAGAYHMLTAAHCWKQSQITTVYRNETSPPPAANRLGQWINDAIPGPGMSCGGVCFANVDAAYFRVDSALVPSTRNTVYRQQNVYESWPITGIRGYSEIVNGELHCAAGITSNLRCGQVTGKGAVNYDYTVFPRYGTDVTLYRNVFSTYQLAGGDSGGPVFAYAVSSNFKAYGIHSGGGANGEFFGSITYALNDMGLTLCTTAAC